MGHLSLSTGLLVLVIPGTLSNGAFLYLHSFGLGITVESNLTQLLLVDV